MSVVDPKRISDGLLNCEGGIDSGSNPSTLKPNQVSFAVNAVMRDGFITNRPGFNQIILRFEDQGDLDYFQDHNVQGVGYYKPQNGNQVLIASVGGRIYKIDPTVTNQAKANVIDITPAVANSSTRRHAWMVQAEQYFIIQDGQSLPIIYDGATARRSNPNAPNYEVPVGTAMEYGLGRLIVVKPDGRNYVVGDIANGPTQVYQFTEHTFLAEGGQINVPLPGRITAVRITSVLDRGIGQGDLLVFTQYGAVSAKIGEKRSTWKDIQFQVVAATQFGALSQFSTIVVNGDVFFRSGDGIRSLAMTQRQFETRWSMSPISHEVERILKHDTEWLLDHCYAVNFNKFLIMTSNPAPVVNGAYHRNMTVLDFEPLTMMSGGNPPAYAGMWTGVRPTALVVGEFPSGERCFVFHRNEDDKNELWEITKDALFDSDDEPIESVTELRSMNFQNGLILKKLDSGDIWVDNLLGTVEFDVKYRPDQYPCWLSWHSWSECATDRDCSVNTTTGCMTVHNYRPQYRSRMLLPQPPDTGDTTDNKPSRLGYEFQTRVAWTGRARIKAMRVHAYDQQEKPYGSRQSGTCKTLECCEIDPNSYLVEGSANQSLNKAAQFTASSSQYLSISDNASLSIGDVDMWFAGWVLLDTTTPGMVMAGKWNAAGTNREWTLDYSVVTGNRFTFTVRSVGDGSQTSVSANAFGAASASTWYFVLVWHDSSLNTINIKIDNGTINSAAHTLGIRDGTASFILGSYDGGASYWNGRMDSVGFGKSPAVGISSLIETISSDLYNNGSGIVYGGLTSQQKTDWGLVSWWDLGESSGTRSDSHGTNDLADNNGVTSADGI